VFAESKGIMQCFWYLQLSAAGPFAIRTHVALSTKTSAFKKVELSTAFERRKQVELSTTAFERQLAALDSFKKAARVSAFSVLRKPETKSGELTFPTITLNKTEHVVDPLPCLFIPWIGGDTACQCSCQPAIG
jgi:hypothetical protein